MGGDSAGNSTAEVPSLMPTEALCPRIYLCVETLWDAGIFLIDSLITK